MQIKIRGAREHNLQGVDVEIGEGLTVVTGVSGSGKTSLVFDTLYHEARRRFLEIYALGSTSARLLPANVESITGLGPAVAVGQNLLNRNPNSTLATASGLHPFLRLLYANFGERACLNCGETLSVYTEDEIIDRLAALVSRRPVSILAPLMRGVPGSHRTLLSMLASQTGIRAILVDGRPWNGQTLEAKQPHDIELHLADLTSSGSANDASQVDLLSAIRKSIQHATALGAQSVKARWEGSEQIFSRAPVCASCGNWFDDLRAVDFNSNCPYCLGKGCSQCRGSGLHPRAAAVRWAGVHFSDLLGLSVDEAVACFTGKELPASATRLHLEITRRLGALQRVGLGYIALDRPSPTLSRGEAQRVRLALTLISRLEDMLHVLDEPTIGQHPADIQRLLPAFRDLSGPVIFVEHDRMAAAGADQAIDLGPGAGHSGGQVVFSGTPTALWQADTPSGRYFSLRVRPQSPGQLSKRLGSGVYSRYPDEFLTIRGAHLRNLQGIDVPIPLGKLTVITGVSGSGKSTLVEDVLVASLTRGKPVGCNSIEGVWLKPVLVDQSPIGRNPRSNPATYTKLADIIRDLFANATGLSPSHFSFNRPEGACPTCNGLGAIEVTMRYLPSTWIPCGECGGQRFSEEVLSARMSFRERLISIADFYDLSVSEVIPLFATGSCLPAASRLKPTDRQAALRILEALRDIGLGYLSLGQPSPTLSGGEAQRVKLARYLGLRSLSNQLLVLDEPSTGLHPQDLSGLLEVLARLACSGATIIVVEHNTDVIRAADWVVDLGPGAGPQGGRLLYTGPSEGLLTVADSQTGQAMKAEESIYPSPLSPIPRSIGESQRPSISIRDARVHNLINVSVDIPKSALTVVTGVSGSGKSSLVHDVLEAEARRRFLETLSLYERQGTREGPEAEVGSVTGLGVALTITSERLVYSRRATVGTATEISHHLAALLASLGKRACLQCGTHMQRGPEQWNCRSCGATAPFARPQHFSSSTYAAACRKCNGIGSQQVPQPKKLIIHPEKPLINGAMYSPGFFPNGYLGKPFNHGYYMVQALAERYGFDPAITPWNQMTVEAQHAFLFGDPGPMQVTVQGRTGRAQTRQATFPGFYGFVRDWDVGGTYTDTVACPECHGARLRPEYLAVTLGGYNVHQLSQMTLTQFVQVIDGAVEPQRQDVATPDHLPLVETSLQTIRRRLRFLIRVGLGYLHLDRVAGTLSAGEVQRIRLAGLLGSGLTSLTLLLDEPTRGMHPSEVEALLGALVELRQEGNTVVVVEHDPLVIRAADYLIDMGPGAGREGGHIVAQGTPHQVAQADTLTARWLRGERRMETHTPNREHKRWLTIKGARANNLHGEVVRFPLGALVGICGVSGSGKSTLMIDTLGRILAPKKQTTSVAYEPIAPGEYDSVEGAPSRTLLVDQSRAGVGSPASYLGLTQPLQDIFSASEDAQALGIGKEQLSAHCSACKGQGWITLDMAFLPDVHIPCETCQGTGLLPEAWEVRLHGVTFPEVFSLTIDQVYELYETDERLARPLQAARDVGLGYLVLRQPGYALSGGEAQRLKIAQELSRKTPVDTLYILDEPSVGQHMEDVLRLADVLRRLVEEGGSVVIIEHHPYLLAACDWLVELGPGGGPQGGRVIASGSTGQVAISNTPTAPYLREILEAAQ